MKNLLSAKHPYFLFPHSSEIENCLFMMDSSIPNDFTHCIFSLEYRPISSIKDLLNKIKVRIGLDYFPLWCFGEDFIRELLKHYNISTSLSDNLIDMVNKFEPSEEDLETLKSTLNFDFILGLHNRN